MTIPAQHVLVPIELTALVSTTGASAEEFVDVTPTYENLGENLFFGDRMVPPPFQQAQSPPAPGVHLHWALPDGLTHGRKPRQTAGPRATGSDVEYPFVPNRWLVVRWTSGAEAQKTRPVAWIVESDALSTSNPGGAIPWPGQEGELYVTQYLGRRVALDGWPGDAGTETLILTALGPGDPTFSAVYTSCSSVFGLHDDLADVAAGTSLTYLVLGWYSNTTYDPMTELDVKWEEKLQDLGWSLAKGVPEEQPTATLLHGTIFGVAWEGPEAPFDPGTPDGAVTVALGNTSVEAVSALVAKLLPSDPAAEELLDALQYGLLNELDDLDGSMQLDEESHKREYGTTDGGVLWRIRPDPTLVGPDRVEAGKALVFVTGDLADRLAALNAAQAAADEQAAIVQSLETALYQTWYAKVAAERQPAGEGPTAEALATLIRKWLIPIVEEAKRRRDGAFDTFDEQHKAILPLLPPKTILDRQGMPRFRQPNNPVLVLTGPGIQRSFKHGADGRFSDDGTLVCRVSGATVTALQVTPVGTSTQVTLDEKALASFFETVPASAVVPTELATLFWEAALLDADLAPVLAAAAYAAGGVSSPTQIQLQATAALIRAIQRGAAAGAVGVAPSPLAVTEWTQPWTPLFLQWQIDFRPSSADMSDAFADWQLGPVDFTWAGGDPQHGSATPIQGSILINPLTAVNLAAPIRQYLRDHPHEEYAKQLEEIADAIERLNVVSQALSGFGSALVQQRQTLQFPIVDLESPALAKSVAELVGTAAAVTPFPDQPLFLPIRAGHLSLLRLAIVDAYGQVQQIASQAAPVSPVLSQQLTTAGRPDVVQLPPRFVQPTRLLYRWMSASAPADAPVVSGDDPETSPLAGWMLVNHLDDSLVLYDAKGAALGELQRIDGALVEGGPGVRWVQAPGTVAAFGAPPQLPNRHLQAFASSILALGQSGQHALWALMQVLDENLWTVNPLGAWQDQSLSFLVGRPLALATASVDIELLGLPAYEKSPTALEQLVKERTFRTGGFLETVVPLRLGDTLQLKDGLVGFFVGDDYSTLNLAQNGTAPPPGQSYVQPNRTLSLQLDPAKPAVNVTMIVDPRAVVHATTGVLPTKKLGLPPDQVADALAAMHVTFTTGPVVSDATTFALPLPDVKGATWSWIEHDTASAWNEVTQIGTPPTTAELDPTPQQIRDGWLKLSGFTKTGSGPSRNGSEP